MGEAPWIVDGVVCAMEWPQEASSHECPKGVRNVVKWKECGLEMIGVNSCEVFCSLLLQGFVDPQKL